MEHGIQQAIQKGQRSLKRHVYEVCNKREPLYLERCVFNVGLRVGLL